MSANQVIVTQAPQVINALITARDGVVKAAKGTGEVIKTYADAMCSAFNLIDAAGQVLTPWYALKGKAKAGVKQERAAFVAAMESAGFAKGTIDVYWQRVKEASGYVTPGNRVSGSMDVDTKTLAELKTMINRIFKADEEGQECEAMGVKHLLIEAFETLGGDVDSLG